MKESPEFLLLGCGYTASRVARILRLSGACVVCTNRKRTALEGCECLELDLAMPESLRKLTANLGSEMTVLHSIPPSGTAEASIDYTPTLLEAVSELKPKRIVYISTTGVYGSSSIVDENTFVAPNTMRDRLRVEAENLVQAGEWSSLILRPAAIYGPGRGVHHSVKLGTYKAPLDGGGVISRIHVDDLAAQVAAALRSYVTGAFPVADEEPCPSIDVAEFATRLLGRSIPERTDYPAREGRRVDGSAGRRALGVKLRFPSYREGVAACIGVAG